MSGYTWQSLNAALASMTESQVLEALEAERRHHRRPTLLVRLHQRACTLRMLREREELLAEAAVAATTAAAAATPRP